MLITLFSKFSFKLPHLAKVLPILTTSEFCELLDGWVPFVRYTCKQIKCWTWLHFIELCMVVSLILILHSYMIKNREKLTSLMGIQMRPWDESITHIHNQVFIHIFVTWSCSNLVHTTSASNFGQNHYLVSRPVVHWNKARCGGIAKKSETKSFSLYPHAIPKLSRIPSDRFLYLKIFHVVKDVFICTKHTFSNF
jgi:hypothetical protein